MYGDLVYGEADPYGEAASGPGGGGGGHSSDCVCGEGWRFELTEFGGPNGGRVKAVVHPIAVEWEDAYSRTSVGSITLAAKDVSALDLWAGTTGIYISQMRPNGTRVGRWGGYIEKFNAVGGGTAQAAMLSVDTFLDKRLIAGPDDPYWLFIDRLVSTTPPPEQTVKFEIWVPAVTDPPGGGFPNQPPFAGTKIYETPFTVGGTSALAAFLVQLAQGSIETGTVVGLRELSAVFESPYTDIDLATSEVFAQWWDLKNIGQAVRELVEAVNGIKYWREHTYINGYWSTILHFSDRVGTARPYTIQSDREAWQYGLEVNAEDKATRVYGVGAGEEGNTLYSVAYDADTANNLPERQSTQAWKDVTNPTRLNKLTRGYVADHRDPVTIPSVTLVGLPTYDPSDPNYDPQRGFPGPEVLKPGDTFKVDIRYGLITVTDLRVRALAVAYRLENGSTTQRTVAMQTIVRANDSVRTQTPAKQVAPTQPVQHVTPPPKSLPWPTPGLVTNVQQNAVDEISGIEYSQANPGVAWVFNDETQTPQVYGIDMRVGSTFATFTPNPGASASPTGDPEAIRLSRSTGKLVLADTGDNDASRPTSGSGQPHLLVVTEPKGRGNKGLLPATRLPVAYPGGNKYNVETLLIHPTTDEVFLVQKATGGARIWSYGPLSSMSTTNNVGTLVTTLTDIEKISDGTHSWDGTYVFFRVQGVQETVVYRAADWKRLGTIPTPPMKKSEAIAVESSCAFLTSTEGADAPIYRVLIPKTFGALCNTQAGPGGGGTGGPNGPATVPSQLLDLSQWKLQLPVSDGDDGVLEIGPDRLTHGYELKPYYWLNTAAEGVVFEAPVNGATTEHSTNPRSELRQLYGNGDEAAWSNSNSTWNMECELAFTSVPGDSDDTRGVVAMQVHDNRNDITVLRLERDLRLWVTDGNNSHHQLIDGSYVLGTWITVRVTARKGGGYLWYLNGTQVATVSGTGSGLYFKTGAYVQISNSSTGKGGMHLRKLRVWKD